MSPRRLRGFILVPTYRSASGRAVIHLWGRLDSGETFLVRDDRFRSYFYVREADADRARRVQRELYERLFDGRPVEDYLRGVVGGLRSGGADGLLVYRKALRKSLDTYTATTPPHVAAARRMTGPPGRVIGDDRQMELF